MAAVLVYNLMYHIIHMITVAVKYLLLPIRTGVV